ncbi:helix-turn-helix domain-containing protein [Roseivirga sp. BDSF3-8]|uniref:helix-turn-helix domain-containing protein n=1 Tax=Roseivirga sp. BDSF3-8 TaxID=3241598 RepID=UPI0035318FA4
MQRQVASLPTLFADYSERISTIDGNASVVHYVQQRSADRVKVKLDSHLIVLIRSGSKMLYHHTGNNTVPPGEGFFLKKGQYLMSEKPQGEMPYESFLIFFNDEFAHRNLSHITTPPVVNGTVGDTCDMVRVGPDLRIDEFGKSLRQYFPVQEPEPFLSSMLTIKIQEIVQLLIMSKATPGFQSLFRRLYDPAVCDLEKLMEMHFKDNLSLEQLAFLSDCSLSTFKRKFEQAYGQSPGKWIQGRKLQEAYTMLATTGFSVKEIAYACGFENSSHFIQSFRQRFGNTPAQYRQALLAS